MGRPAPACSPITPAVERETTEDEDDQAAKLRRLSRPTINVGVGDQLGSQIVAALRTHSQGRRMW